MSIIILLELWKVDFSLLSILCFAETYIVPYKYVHLNINTDELFIN